jgi:solute carrier family 50 protein (sugar transporter)
MNTAELLGTLAALGTVFSVALYLAPFPSFYRAWKTQSLSEISPYFLLFSVLSSLCWVLYAKKTDNWDLLIPNAITAGLALLCVALYHWIESNFWLYMLKFCAASIALILFMLHYMGIDDIGVVCAVTNVIPFVAPIEQLTPVFLEKNARYIDSNVLVAGLLNSGVWSGFGIISRDAFVFIPNALGVLACVIEFVIILWTHGWIPN